MTIFKSSWKRTKNGAFGRRPPPCVSTPDWNCVHRYCRPERPHAFGRPRRFYIKRGWSKPKLPPYCSHPIWGIQALGTGMAPRDHHPYFLTSFLPSLHKKQLCNLATPPQPISLPEHHPITHFFTSEPGSNFQLGTLSCCLRRIVIRASVSSWHSGQTWVN